MNADPDLTEKSRVMHIVIGLPEFIREKLSRQEVTTYNKLMIELNQLESLVNKPFRFKNSTTDNRNNNNINSNNKTESILKATNQKQKPCTICGNKPGRFHPEVFCRNRKSVGKNIKIVNNTELENVLNEEIKEQKN